MADEPLPAEEAPGMTFYGQISDGRDAVVEFNSGDVTIQVDGEVHGPKSIVGSLVNREGNGTVWTVGLGSIRADFTPDDHEAFNKGMSWSLVESGMEFAEMMSSLVQMAPTFTQAGEAMSRSLDNLGVIAQLSGVPTPDFSDAKRAFEVQVRQHQQFIELWAPRGWALAPILESPWRIHVIAADFVTKAGADPDDVDEWLANEVVHHSRVNDIVDEMARAPVRAIWQWSFLAGAAARAMELGLWGPAAFTWLTIAEGLWVELGGWIGTTKPKFFKKGVLRNQRITESLTKSRESLVIAHDYMSRPVKKTYLEPIDLAPTRRHGLLHGRISGISRVVHAAKAITVVDSILEQATVAIKVAKPGDLESPPWI